MMNSREYMPLAQDQEDFNFSPEDVIIHSANAHAHSNLQIPFPGSVSVMASSINRRNSSPGAGAGGVIRGQMGPGQSRSSLLACLRVFCNRNLKLVWSILLLLAILVLYFTYRYLYDPKFDPQFRNRNQSQLDLHLPLKTREGHTKPSDFMVPKLSSEWYDTNCFQNKDLGRSINNIYEKLQLMKVSSDEECRIIWSLFDNMFAFEYIEARIVLPMDFQKEVKGWLGNDPKLFDQVQHQRIYKIISKSSHEETVYNPLRSKRPTSKSAINPVDYIANLTASTQPSCDFCKYKDHTAEDTFGRIENTFSASASNTFKLSKFHGLFFVKTHHPIDIAYEAIVDLFVKTSQQWFQKAFETDSGQRYPSLLWDTLPHAGASQVHPHVHGILNSGHYSGHIEQLHVISQEYFKKFQRSYWTDLIRVHFALGLGLELGTSVAIVPLFARKDHEYMILSPKVNEDFVKLIFSIMEGYKSKLGVYCFSAGGSYHYMETPETQTKMKNKEMETYDMPGLPVMFRFGSRGVCTTVSSDVSSLELYSINNINSDLSLTIDALESMISD